MKYEIFGNNFPAVTIYMDRGESIFTQTGGLAWMTDRIDMETNMRGGILGGLSRLFSGDSMFIANYTASADNQAITLSASLPGELRALRIDGDHEYIAQKGAFLGATQGVEVEAAATNSFMAGLFGGEGFFLQHLIKMFLMLKAALKSLRKKCLRIYIMIFQNIIMSIFHRTLEMSLSEKGIVGLTCSLNLQSMSAM